MSWDYCELSKLAKDNGGPEALLTKHAEIHFKKGAESMTPVVVVSSLIALGVGVGITIIFINIKGKRAIADADNRKIEAELIAGMKQAEKE